MTDTAPTAPEATATKYILCIDGGGIRGLIPAIILRNLEERVNQACATAAQSDAQKRELWQCFDLIAGTSTGGIIAAGLTARGPDTGQAKRAACTPTELANLYAVHGEQIFPQNWTEKLRKFFTAEYDPSPLEALLAENLGNTTMHGALTNVVITAYDLVGRDAVLFRGGPAFLKEPDYLLKEVARATSAAPTYFPPARVTVPGQSRKLTLIDGGVFANDPTLVAMIEGCKLGWKLSDMKILSIGTGTQTRSYSYHDARRWGLLDWIAPSKGAPIISILMQGSSSTIGYQAKRLLPDGAYLRLNGPLSANDELDDASEANIETLQAMADDWLNQNDTQLTALAKELAARP